MTSELILKPTFKITNGKPKVVGIRAITPDGKEVILKDKKVIDRYFDILEEKNKEHGNDRNVKVFIENKDDEIIFKEFSEKYEKKYGLSPFQIFVYKIDIGTVAYSKTSKNIEIKFDDVKIYSVDGEIPDDVVKELSKILGEEWYNSSNDYRVNNIPSDYFDNTEFDIDEVQLEPISFEKYKEILDRGGILVEYGDLEWFHF